MLRATDRLKEAEFFLEKLIETHGKEDEFRYYLSALVSAARSITLVLQKDLRSKHSPQFDDWWSEKKQTIPDSPISFETIRNLRNILQKEGYKIPRVIDLINRDAIFENATVLFDTVTSDLTIKFKIPEGGGPVSTRNSLPGESEDEFVDRVVREIIPIVIRDAMDQPELELLGFALTEDSSPLSFDSLIDGFSIYLSAVRDVVKEAEYKFSQTGTEPSKPGAA